MVARNFLVDMGMQEQVATPVQGVPPYLASIQRAATQPIVSEEPEYKKWGLNNEDEFKLMNYVKETGGSADDFTEVLADFRTKTEPNQPTPIEEEKGLFKEITEAPGRIVGAGIAQLPDIVGNVGGFFIGKPVDFLLEKAGVDAPSLEEQFKADGIEKKKDLQDILGIDPDDFTTDIGEFGAEVGSLFIPGGQAKLLAKFPGAATKIGKLGTAIEKMGTKAPKTFNTLKSALTGAKEFGKFEIVSEGEVTPSGLAIGAVAHPLIGTTIKTIGKVTKTLASKLELAGLLNPAKLDKVAKQLQAQGIEETSSVADFLLKKSIKGSKESIVKKLSADATASRKIKESALRLLKKETFDKESGKALKVIINNLDDKAGLEDDLARFLKLQKKLESKGLNTTEKDQIKRGMDKFINIFKDSGEVIAGTNKQGASNIRAALQKQIENEAGQSSKVMKFLKDNGFKSLKEVNKNTQVSFTLAESIARKDAADQAGALVSAFAPSGVGAIAGGLAPGEDIFDRLRNMVLGAVIGKVAGSTLVKTNAANFLNKLSGIEKIALDKFIETKGGIALEAGILNKLFNNQ